MSSQSSPSTAVLITGCSSGIGRATAERLASAGHTVYATARQPETIADLEASGCRTLALDVTDEASMAAAVEAVEAEHGAVGALVNNAGYSQSGAVETVADGRRAPPVRDQRLRPRAHVPARAARRCARQRRGRIVNISSMGANFTFPGGGFYHATKYAVEAISDALRFEVKGFGVDVVVIQPGLDPDRVRRDGGDRGRRRRRPTGPYARVQRGGRPRRRTDAYEKGAAAQLGGGPEAVAKAIEQAITAKPPADPLPRHALRAPADQPARADAGRHVGPVRRDAVPAARSAVSEVRVVLLGDRDLAYVTHRELDAALAVFPSWAHGAWVPTDGDVKAGLDAVDGVWVVPGTPYRDDDAVYAAIGRARESGLPLLGTCGGFQYAVVELARGMAGLDAATRRPIPMPMRRS